MCIITKKYLLFLFALLPFILFSQEVESNNIFDQLLEQKTSKFNNSRFFSKAKLFFYEQEWDSTLLYSMKVLNLKNGDQELSNYCHFLRGYSLFEKQVFKEAEKELLEISKDFDFHNNVIMFLGTIALEEYKFQKALEYFIKIEEISDKELLGIKRGNVEYNIGLCYLHLKKYDEAEAFVIKSIKSQEKTNDTVDLIGSYGNAGSFYYNQYKDAQAIPYFEKAYELAKTTNNFLSKKTAALNMAIVEEDRKNYKSAIAYRKEHDQWKDSLTNQNDALRIIQLEKTIAIKDKEKQVSLLQVENKVKIAERNTFLYSAIILLLLLLASIYFYREKVKSNKIINLQKENLDELNATKDKLFSIVSHDLRSSVNAIKISNKKLINNLETQNIQKVKSLLNSNSSIVNSAYTLLDNLLNWALLQTKQSFFHITKLRLANIVEHVSFNYKAILAEKEISFQNKVDKKDIVYADQESLKIILRNLIDNAIKFTKTKGSITIYTQKNDSNLCSLIVEDTGIGMDKKTRDELLQNTSLLAKKKHEDIIGTGLGMQLCKSMTQKNNGTFSIESELGKGTKIIISLPKNLPNEPN
ncbi:tetratricopeptide repeat-containing sensor histidine kinase [Kordia sp.]|uniref:tetratricopeptide repeat-containing sensor histidine kinase n=1 Tax=Kordia sp. TaxID=1965332 RepID=UPI003B591267